MARVTVDFSQVEEFAPVEEGQFEAEITGVEYREPASEDKYPYINVEYTIREDGEFQGSKVWGIWSLSPKALWRMKDSWENLGILQEGEEIDIDYDEETMAVTEPELVGMPCLVKVVQENYEGKTRSRAEGVTALDGPVAKEEKRTTTAAKKPAAKKTAAKPAAKTATGSSRRKFQ